MHILADSINSFRTALEDKDNKQDVDVSGGDMKCWYALPSPVRTHPLQHGWDYLE